MQETENRGSQIVDRTAPLRAQGGRFGRKAIKPSRGMPKGRSTGQRDDLARVGASGTAAEEILINTMQV